MTSQLNVLFKSQQKDDKKEVLKFEIKGNENSDVEGYWYSLAGSIVVFNVGGCAADDVTGEFINMQRDSKKTVVKLAIKGDNEEKARELYRFAGRNVPLSITSSQMSIEEFYNEEGHEGIGYTVGKDGSVDVDSDQVTTDELGLSDEAESGDSKVTDIHAPRVTKKEKEAARLAALEQEELDKEPSQLKEDEDLPLF